MARPRKLELASPDWPKIRRRPRADGTASFMVDSGTPINGKRIQKTFPTQEAAETYAASIRLTHANSGTNAFVLSDGQRDDARLALEALAKAGVRESLQAVAEFYLLHNRPPAGTITLEDLRNKYLENRSRAGLRPRSLADLEARTKQFTTAIGGKKLVQQISETEVETYLNRAGISELNRKNDFASIRSLFEFAMRPRDYRGRKTRREAPITGWIARNPVYGVHLPPVPDSEPAVLSADSAKALLRAAYETRLHPAAKFHPDRIGALPEVVLGLFAGLRPSEIHRLQWRDIELGEAKGNVNVRVSKNRAGVRNIDLSEVAVQWLLLCPNRTGPVHIAKNFRRRWSRLKERAEIDEWPQDVLRHTFASVHFRLNMDAGRTRAALGHSTSETGTLFAHYRALMTESEARAILELTPDKALENPDNVVPMHHAQKSEKARQPSKKTAAKASR